MAGSTAVYSTAMLREQQAQPYKSMAGKLQAPLLKALDSMGYEYMTPVQQKVLTELPSLSSDCLVQAKTGTGKTIAFLLPALQSLLTDQTLPDGQVGILILSPTRELALQIAKECDQITPQLPRRVECHTAFGGTKKEKYLSEFLKGKPTVLVATPGRLNDYLSDERVAQKFGNLRTLILDEADTMLEAGFLQAINDILRRLPPKSKGWQGMCFSATMPEKIKGVLSGVLKPGYSHLSTVDPNEVPTIDAVTQHSVVMPNIGDTFDTLLTLIKQEHRQSPNDFKAIVFATTANGVALLAALFETLVGKDMKVYQLQSRLSQNVRTKTTEEFKATSAGLMFASDVIGRGMDFPNVNLVIQVGLPMNGEQYVHRVGRTARAGNEGRAVILLTERESYFLRVNKHLPIRPYPINIVQSRAGVDRQPIINALATVDESRKSKAYQAWLGFHKTFTKQLRVDNNGLVALANEYATAMGCPEPPMISKQVVGKMGLKGLGGLNVGEADWELLRRAQRPNVGGAPSARPNVGTAPSVRPNVGTAPSARSNGGVLKSGGGKPRNPNPGARTPGNVARNSGNANGKPRGRGGRHQGVPGSEMNG